MYWFFIILTSTIFYASLTPLLKKANLTIEPFTTISISMLVLFLISFFMSVFYENSMSTIWNLNKNSVFILILVGVLNFIWFYLQIKWYSYMQVWQQQLFTILTPLIWWIISYYILNETLNVNFFIWLFIISIWLFVSFK